ncbi:argininosuccinate lyase [Myxococcota bacterium]|nr:argininosuccinate lyase [Myxococcota bacterium]
MPLWKVEGQNIDAVVEAFTVGEDPILDLELLPFDCLASAAHAYGLKKANLLTDTDFGRLLPALQKAFTQTTNREWEIKRQQEDGHTALEEFLVGEVGDAGKRIHTGRSRNDQVIAATRLYIRSILLDVAEQALALSSELIKRGHKEVKTLMPGYTHTRQAMPSTVGQLFFSVAEGLIRDVQSFEPALQMASRSALGSASGYGVPLPLQREEVAVRLGLSLDINSIYIQNTRGKLEQLTLFALSQLTQTLGRFATDMLIFSSEAFGYFSLPEALTTGSSIMPQKRNPDLLELCRAVPASMNARLNEVSGITQGLGAGYHRDLQRVKKPTLEALAEVQAVLAVMSKATQEVEVHRDKCSEALRPEIYATDEAIALVQGGMPFRDAYATIKKSGAKAMSEDEVFEPRRYLGGAGSDQSEILGEFIAQQRVRLEPFVMGAEKAKNIFG